MRRTIKNEPHWKSPFRLKSPYSSFIPDLIPEDDKYQQNVSLASSRKTRDTTPESKLESSGGRIEAFALVQSLDKPSATENVEQSSSDRRYSLDMSPTVDPHHSQAFTSSYYEPSLSDDSRIKTKSPEQHSSKTSSTILHNQLDTPSHFTQPSPRPSFQHFHPSLFLQRPTSGLPNIGSSCYLNSALQALAHVPILLHLLQTAYQLRPTPRPHKKTSNTHITQLQFDSMLRLSEDVQDALAFLTTFPPSHSFRDVEQLMFHLHKNLGIVNPQFVGFKQNDSHEALLTLLDVLDETTMPIASADDESASAAEARADDASELVVVFKPNQPTAQRLALLSSLFASFQATPRTPIRDSCTGLLGGTVLCHSCGQARVSLHAFTALSLPLPPTPFFSFGHAHRIETLLAEMAVCSEVEGFVCSCCGRAGQTVTHGEFVAAWPKVLFLHFSRSNFRFSAFSRKDSSKVSIPAAIDSTLLRSAFADFERRTGIAVPMPDTPYQLAGTINHVGMAQGGHYTFVGRSVGDVWTKHSDNTSSPATRPSESSEAYVCVYQQVSR
ncbi:putative Ubiquitin carboxyl-terminal hydrolase [Blattamonas nauphoetae]|uniref:Ubiquitin carboxyl-terminal hydrolase n=1 Tax=Blattamonas nauphoetae TaxID=2049346 RepID=A0ABQ9XFT4_9EUKA|nr:putative Ubiquitin carboxyl-terminal hydrolase [Blattamonas nauphoetae]